MEKQLAFASAQTVKAILKSKEFIPASIAFWGQKAGYQNMNASSLTAIFTIRLNDPGMYNAFRASRPAGWTFALMQGFGIARFYF